MSELVELRERIRAAHGPDRELNSVIAKLAGEPYGVAHSFDTEANEYITVDDCAANYSGSIDAALGLVEQLLPGRPWNLENVSGGGCSYLFELWVTGVFMTTWGSFMGAGATAPLAILDALLSALIAKQETP